MMRHRGFTLLEVLVAVVIVAIALVALLSTTTHIISGHQHLTDKTLGIWVGDNTLHQVLQNQVSNAYGETTMGTKQFSWEIKKQGTQTPALKAIGIIVYEQDNQIGNLQGYVFDQDES